MQQRHAEPQLMEATRAAGQGGETCYLAEREREREKVGLVLRRAAGREEAGLLVLHVQELRPADRHRRRVSSY